MAGFHHSTFFKPRQNAMRQIRIPAAFIRGGTSNAIIFNERILPRAAADMHGVHRRGRAFPGKRRARGHVPDRQSRGRPADRHAVGRADGGGGGVEGGEWRAGQDVVLVRSSRVSGMQAASGMSGCNGSFLDGSRGKN